MDELGSVWGYSVEQDLLFSTKEEKATEMAEEYMDEVILFFAELTV